MRLDAYSVACVGATLAAHAELQSLKVGAKLETYGAWYSDFYDPTGAGTRIPLQFLGRRSIGPFGTDSSISAGRDATALAYGEQRTRLHVRATFTDCVTTYLEFDDLRNWGDSPRSSYLTGSDFTGQSPNPLQLYQAYVTLDDLLGLRLRLRVGRQEIVMGSGWLVGAEPGPDPNIGISFDALRFTYAWDLMNAQLDLWWAKLAERSGFEKDGDTDFYGVYFSASPFPHRDLRFDLYWMLLRDAANVAHSHLGPVAERLENWVGVDDYEPTYLHTAGFRTAGSIGRLDGEVETAYQWGDADAWGALFVPLGARYGDHRAQWNNFGGHVDLGFTLQGDHLLNNTRLYAGGSYYGGNDRRDISLLEWLNPFRPASASSSFNRLFSSWREDSFLDSGELSNFYYAYIGAEIPLADKVAADISWSHYWAVDEFDAPRSLKLLGQRYYLFPSLPFLTRQGPDDMGSQLLLSLSYDYSDDLSFELGWSSFFVGEAIEDGVFAGSNGLAYIGGQNNEEAHYLYWYAQLEY